MRCGCAWCKAASDRGTSLAEWSGAVRAAPCARRRLTVGAHSSPAAPGVQRLALHRRSARTTRVICAAGTCGAGNERGNGTVSAGALDAGCGDRVLTSRISRDGYPTCGRRPGDRRQRGRRPFGCGVRCPGQGHVQRRAAIRGLLTTLNSPPSTRNPRNSQPSTHHPDGRILQYVPHTGDDDSPLKT